MIGSSKSGLGSTRTAAEQQEGGGAFAEGRASLGLTVGGVAAGGTAVNIRVTGDSLMIGVPDSRYSIMYRLLGKIGNNALTLQPGGYLSHWFRAAGCADPVVSNTAVGGTTTADALTNVTAWFITGAPDGSDIFANFGINDVIGNVAASVSAQNVAQILQAVFAARPNSRVHWVSALWAGGEQWQIVNGRAVGANSRDSRIQATNAAIQAVVNQFSHAHYYDVYSDVYAWSAVNNVPAPGTSPLYLTSDGTHPGQMGAKVVAQSLFRILSAKGGLFPTFVQPSSQLDMVEGDWYQEQQELWSTNIRAGNQPALTSFNRWVPFQLPPLDEAIVSEPNIEGGGVKIAASGNGFAPLFPTTIWQTPKTRSFLWVARVKFPANAADRSAFIGLGDLGTNDDLLGFGYDDGSTGNSGKWLIRERHASTETDKPMAVSAVANVDALEHDVAVFFDGGASGVGAGIYDVYIDGQLGLHTNPTANFPTTPQGLMAGLTNAGGYVIVKRGLFAFNEG